MLLIFGNDKQVRGEISEYQIAEFNARIPPWATSRLKGLDFLEIWQCWIKSSVAISMISDVFVFIMQGLLFFSKLS